MKLFNIFICRIFKIYSTVFTQKIKKKILYLTLVVFPRNLLFDLSIPKKWINFDTITATTDTATLVTPTVLWFTSDRFAGKSNYPGLSWCGEGDEPRIKKYWDLRKISKRCKSAAFSCTSLSLYRRADVFAFFCLVTDNEAPSNDARGIMANEEKECGNEFDTAGTGRRYSGKLCSCLGIEW